MLTTNLYDPPAPIRVPSAGDDLLQRRVAEFNSAVDEFRGRWRELRDRERLDDERRRAGKGDPNRDVDDDRGESLRAGYAQQEELIERCIGSHRDRAEIVASCLTALRVAFKETEAELSEAVETVTSDLGDQGWDAGCLDGQALAHSRSIRGFAGAMRQSARERLFETVVVRSHPDVADPRDRANAIRKEVAHLQASDNSAEQVRKLNALRRSLLQTAARDGAVRITL